MDGYKSNSDNSRNLPDSSERRVEPVVSGTARIQEKTGFGKLAESFIVEDAKSVGSYLLTDVIIPSCKKVLSDIVTNGIDMLLYGKAGISKSSNSNISRVSYSNYYNRSSDTLRAGSNGNTSFNYDNIIFETRGEAEKVLVNMYDILDQFEYVRVGDFYDLANVPISNFTVNDYGWYSLKGSDVYRCRDGGYIIKLPKATPIK